MNKVQKIKRMFEIAMSLYVVNMKRTETKNGYRIHGEFVSPRNGNKFPFLFCDEQRQGAFGFRLMDFQITDGLGWGNSFYAAVEDEGFWCETIETQGFLGTGVNLPMKQIREEFKDFLFSKFNTEEEVA